MREKRGFLALLVLAILCTVLFSAAVHADTAFDVQVLPLDYDITPNEQAVFQVSITNNGDVSDSFRLSVPDISWTVTSKPLYDYFGSMDVPSKQVKSTVLYLNPTSKMAYSQYRIELSVKSDKTGISKSQYMLIDLKSPSPVIKEYLAAVRKIVEVPSLIDPRQEFPIIINLDNRNPKNISELIIAIKSNLITNTQTVSLGPLEKKVVTVNVKLDDLTPPQEDVLAVSLIIDNQTLDPVIKEPFAIRAYSTIKTTEAPIQKSLFKTEKDIIYTNEGNVVKQFTADYPIGPIQRFFAASNMDSYTVEKTEGTYLAWDLELQPNESITIEIVTDYTRLFAAIVLAILLLALYFAFRSPVIIRKDAVVVETKEGGVSELKVLLQVKNRSDKNFDKVTVTDRISKIGELSRQPEMGTLKPSQLLSHEKEGTIVKWELGNLDRFEERIISYRIKSKLTVIGSFYLAPASIKYTDKNNKHRTSKSNSLRVKS